MNFLKSYLSSLERKEVSLFPAKTLSSSVIEPEEHLFS